MLFRSFVIPLFPSHDKDGVCKECEGSGRLKRIVKYEKFGSIVEEATRLLGNEVKEDELDDFETYLKTALVKNGITKPPVRRKI